MQLPRSILMNGHRYVRVAEPTPALPAPEHQRCPTGQHWDGHQCRPVAGFTPSNKPIYKPNSGITGAGHPVIQADKAKSFVRRNHADFTAADHTHAASTLQSLADKHSAQTDSRGAQRPVLQINRAKGRAYEALAKAHRHEAKKKKQATTP